MITSRSTKLTIGVFFLQILSGFASSEERTPDKSLCTEVEDIYFSCQLDGGKIISICAAYNLSPGSGYVQYRFGLPDKIEMAYPSQKKPPEGIMFFVNASEGSVTEDILKFKKGPYTYKVSQAFVSFITVLKEGKVIYKKNCDPGSRAFISRKARTGIQEIQKTDEDFR